MTAHVSRRIRTAAWRLLLPGLLVCVGAATWSAHAASPAELVLLVTLDGARPDEVFGGLDVQALRSTNTKVPVESLGAYQRYWAPTPEARRQKLMPFFWGTLVRDGVIAGNRALGSPVSVSNSFHFSYPGYSEILTGVAHPDVDSNDARRNPHETVLEVVRRRLGLPASKVAVFASWNVFDAIAEHVPGAITINAGVESRQPAPGEIDLLNRMQEEASTPWDGIRHDTFTFRQALAYLKAERPRLLYIALDETDDWAHDGKYDRVLDAYRRTDDDLRRLWEWVQSDPQYAGRTALIVSTDHGRGSSLDGWRSHGAQTPGSDQIWIAAAGAGVSRRGELRNVAPLHQSQIAATVATLLGLDLAADVPGAAKPLTELLDR